MMIALCLPMWASPHFSLMQHVRLLFCAAKRVPLFRADDFADVSFAFLHLVCRFGGMM
jgi:hypothetical protein